MPRPLASEGALGAHGLWTPAVVLMRNLAFAPKMALLMALMAAALAALAFAYYDTQLGNIRFSAKERDGVRYLQALYPVLDASLSLRRDATAEAAGRRDVDRAASQRAFEEAWQRLLAVDQALGAQLDTAAARRAVEDAMRSASVRAGDVGATFRSYSATPKALIDLAAQACDGSNLTLDPDVDSYYVMDAVCFRLPDMKERVGAMRGAGGGLLAAGQIDPAIVDQLLRNEAVTLYLFDALRAGLAKTIRERPSTQAAMRVDDAYAPIAAFLKLVDDKILNAQTLEPAAAAPFVQAGNVAVREIDALQQRLLPLLDALLAERVAGLQREMAIRSSVIAVLVLLAAYFAYGFYRVNRGGTELVLMAEGDLREPPPPPWGRDEPAQIIRDLQTAYQSLEALIRKVRHSARDLASASEEIAHASRDLGARTEAAAATLEEQASAMEQIGSQVDSTAQRAGEAAEFSRHNAQLAGDSRAVVDNVVGTMREIQTSSQKIADITQVIDGIAFQTNILALNAAVEAARAGEAGRGFAVVAGEVRSLAQKSAEAAKQIKSLIEESVAKVNAGVTVVENAGQAMGKLVHNAETINRYMGEISTAAREQSTGVAQTVQAIQQLDATTQQNAALVEQTSAAADALEQQANRLMEEIARFRL